MGCMIRSDKMSKCQMYLQMEVVFDVLAELGELDCVQFIDLFPELQFANRNFVFEVCRYSEMEVKLQYIRNAMEQLAIEPLQEKEPSVAKRLQDLGPYELLLDKWKKDIEEMNNNEKDLLQSYFELCEFHYVLTYIGPMLGSTEVKKHYLLFNKKSTFDADSHRTGRLMVTAGAVRRSSAAVFELLLWRICKGIIYYKQAREDKVLIDPKSRQESRKVAFLVVCQGNELSARVQKVCNGFQVSTFPCPDTAGVRNQLQTSLVHKMLDLEQILKETRFIRCTYLRKIAQDIRWWQNSIKKSKAIFYTMNMFRKGDNYILVGEAWIPDEDIPIVQDILERNSVNHNSCAASFNAKISSYDMPPTFHRTNKFTRGFQNLINAYGDSTYRELNPGLYTIITFPFLFAIMFGDMGHGFILFIFGVYMWWNEKKIEDARSTNEIWTILFGGRYVILLMGLFSIYTGFFYNDLFSRAFSLGDSYWINTFSNRTLADGDLYVDLDPQLETRKPYVYGEDPVWRMAKNKIMFENSFKMKMSIIIGVIHMTFGLILSFINYLYFKKYYAICFQFIPEILFLLLIFAWMAVMIFLKWVLFSPKSSDPEKNTQCAPQILILFIDMALAKTTVPANEGCKDGYLINSQELLQKIFIRVAMICVPVLLLGTPIYKILSNRKKRKAALAAIDDYKNSGVQKDPVLEKELLADVEKYSAAPSELMIHQAVHCIEYVLSTISHTASYLRLWALSLAHSQLSDMLWHMILSQLALQRHGIKGVLWLVPIFALWAMFTVAILVVMEGLSAFLHCLRLHWVEFMSKFYEGGGKPFRPFSFAVLLEDERTVYDSTCKKYKLIGKARAAQQGFI